MSTNFDRPSSLNTRAAFSTDPVETTKDQRDDIAAKKATCPFIGTAVATSALPVRNDPSKPLASIDDVRRLGDTGGGNLGEVLKVFAQGNHAFMPGPTGQLNVPVPNGQFSLDFPGSQGSHPGHSGILQGDPKQLNSGRFSEADFDRLTSRATKDGYVKRSEVAKFIAENMIKDPNSKVFGANVAKLLGGDIKNFVKAGGEALLSKIKGGDAGQERKAYEALTKTLGEDNLVGSSGEFGLLFAFLANKPGAKTIDGEPAISVADLTSMFKDKKFPPGWETWPKTAHDWTVNTTALTLEAAKEYVKLKHDL